jgi:hypothetical protein
MKKLLILPILSIVLFACQKEISFEDPNVTPPSGGGGGNTTGTKLVKLVQKSGSDSAVVNLTYNSANKLTSYSEVQVSGGQTADLSVNLIRNSSNIITQAVITSSQLAPLGIPSITTNFNYDAATSKYKYSILSISILGTTYKDSTTFTYDVSNRLTTATTYADDGTGSGYLLDSKEEYTYTGSNVASVKASTFNDQTNVFDVDVTESYEYDAKVNPSQFVSDAVVLRILGTYASFFSANNITKQTTVDATTGTEVITMAYTYNTSNRPTVGTLTAAAGTATVTYYYQ